MLLLLLGCGVHAQPAATHPAQPTAQTGRLAGAPASLRPGVVQYPDVPALRSGPAPDHSHHHK